jgi:hypothetical protein
MNKFLTRVIAIALVAILFTALTAASAASIPVLLLIPTCCFNFF